MTSNNVEETEVVATAPGGGAESSQTTTQEQGNQEEDKKRKTWQTFDKLTTDFRAALEIAGEDGEFRDIIEYHGYTPARREEGLKMIKDAMDADQAKKDKKAEQHKVSRRAGELRRTAQRTLSQCVPSARLAFKDDPESLEILGLNRKRGKQDQTFGGWAAFGSRFFEKAVASPEMQAELAKFNIPLTLLETGNQQMTDAVEADKEKRSKKADAENATAYKNQLYRKLLKWMKDFYKIVEIAFRELPQLKEKVGIVVPYLT
ncbi:MAG: hypothetical protein GY950_32235 [bacterium]|nr:hypothetical protein [bacterium]